MIKSVIFDIDGTLSNADHRQHHLMKDKKDWKSFYDEMHKDTPNHDIITLSLLLYSSGQPILICTGRPEEHRGVTEGWLEQANIKYSKLYMRPTRNYEPDYVVKKELLVLMKKDGYDPIMVFEDRTQVVQMWREAGIRCLQVCEGDY